MPGRPHNGFAASTLCTRTGAGRARPRPCISRAWFQATREAWAVHTNRALERAGHTARIDHRNLAEQGITDRLPGTHIGPHVLAMERRGVQTDRGTEAIQRAELNEQLRDLDAEIAELHTHEEVTS